MRTKRFLAALAITTGLVLPVIHAGPAQAGRDDDKFVVALYEGLAGVDTFNLTTPVRLLRGIIDGFLTGFNAQGGIEPAIAESYNFPDPNTLDFVLREGVKFHDGSVLNADDVVFTFEATQHPGTAATSLAQRTSIWLDRVEKTGPMSVRLHLNPGSNHALVLFDLAGGIPLRQKDAFEPGVVQTEVNALGPYKVISWNDQEINFERHDDFYNPDKIPKIKFMTIRNIPDWGTQQAEMLSGGINFMFAVPEDIAQNLVKSNPGLDLVRAETMSLQLLSMNPAETVDGKPNALANADVRRGIIHAINRQSIIDNLRPGRRVTDTPCQPDQTGCDVASAVAYEYSPEKAKELFAKAGFADGFDLTIWAASDEDIAGAITADLTAAGVRAELRVAPEATIEKMAEEKNLQMLMELYGNSSNPDIFRSVSVIHNPKEDTAIALDPEVTAVLEELTRTMDTDPRNELFKKLVNLITDKALQVPISTVTQNWVLNDVVLRQPVDKATPRFAETVWK